MAIVIKKVVLDSIGITRFGNGAKDAGAGEKNHLGGKGANLCEMASLGLPVPPGFILPTSACVAAVAAASDDVKFEKFLKVVKRAIAQGLEHVGYDRLLSVRSGARVSMPGMMDTILNVGITPENLPVWEEKLGARAARDSYRRFLQMFGSVALGIPMEKFEGALRVVKDGAGVENDIELSPYDLSKVIAEYVSIYAEAGQVVPDSIEEQLVMATMAVFDSWQNPRAVEYRKIHGIPNSWGTAVTIQVMVFGNLNDDSATGVVFTRDPSTGEKQVTGEFLINAQGEDVVAGIRTPIPLDKMSGPDKVAPGWGAIHHDLLVLLKRLEEHYKDMQDVEFTVQDGELFILQTRNAKRSATAAFRCAYDMVNEGLITKEDIPSRINAKMVKAVMTDTIAPSFKELPSLVGIPAGGSVVSGVAVFTSEDAVNCKEPCILVTKETDPDDIAGMNAAVGILTATGGLTSHAAVVARGMNKTCVVGCTDMDIPAIKMGLNTKITIDGSTGNVWVKVDVPVIKASVSLAAKRVCLWASGDSGDGLLYDLTGEESTDQLVGEFRGWNAVRVKTGALPHAMVGTALTTLALAFEKTVTEAPGTSLYLDTTVKRGPVDAAYFTMLCSDDTVEEDVLGCLVTWGISLKSRVVLTAKKYVEGFLGGGPVKTFADLLGGHAQPPTQDVIDNVFGGLDAYNKAVELVGPKVLKAPPEKYWYEFMEKEQ